MSIIHEIKQALWLSTPHGDGLALFIMDYGLHNDTIFAVALENGGAIKHYQASQVTICKNHTIELPR